MQWKKLEAKLKNWRVLLWSREKQTFLDKSMYTHYMYFVQVAVVVPNSGPGHSLIAQLMLTISLTPYSFSAI